MHRQFTCLLLTERSKGKMGRLGVRVRVINGKPMKFVLTFSTIVLNFVLIISIVIC